MYPSIIWRMNTSEKKIYLTFDDGPIPEVTPKVIALLNQYNAKATFFCVGNNVQKYPYEYSLLQKNNHAIGNHTHQHINGFKSSIEDYVTDVAAASSHIKSTLFRPPYGRIKPAQYIVLKKKYNIIMWDVLSYDFDANITREKCWQNVLQKTRKGSIIVFHDSVKAADKMLYALPRFLEHFTNADYSFESINEKNISNI